MKKKRKIIQLLLALIIGIILEIFVFNYSYVKSRIDASKVYNEIYTLDDMLTLNWDIGEKQLVSKTDPQLILESLNTVIDEIIIKYQVEGTVSDLVIFYTEAENQNFSEERMIQKLEPNNGENEVMIGKYVKNIRFDLGDASGVVLNGLEVIVNPIEFDFSVSRVVAVVLIFFITQKLFALQDPVDYEID